AIDWPIPSTAIELATSPARCPPIPSQTTKRPRGASTRKRSSFRSRTRPTSVLPAAARLAFWPLMVTSNLSPYLPDLSFQFQRQPACGGVDRDRLAHGP